jgi:hypothetical protein
MHHQHMNMLLKPEIIAPHNMFGVICGIFYGDVFLYYGWR